jgi:hypothetical protein
VVDRPSLGAQPLDQPVNVNINKRQHHHTELKSNPGAKRKRSLFQQIERFRGRGHDPFW